MPKNRFQEIVFSILMVFVMVYGMVCYNISIAVGGVQNFVFLEAFKELPIMMPIAFLLETFIAGPQAKRQAFKLVTPGKDKPIMIILAISTFTVMFMCPMMSFAAVLLFKGGFSVNTFAVWVQTVAVNFPMAFCWQIFAAGPFVRFLFRKLFPEKKGRADAENR